MKRGLRQGCSLSPYLFNIIVEALSVLLKKVVSINLFDGFKVVVTHLQFADYTLIFCDEEASQICNVKRFLQCFQVISGLKINFNKSRLVGSGVDRSALEEKAASIGYEVGELPINYLGLSLRVKANSVAIWDPIIDKFEKKLSGWRSQWLSVEARVVLTRSILGSLPFYYMSLFKTSCFC
ncbi:hypothetical protein PTKIN_Ptkin14bG0146400 [Pterospermum kingtungense]